MPDDASADTSGGQLYGVLETEKVNPATVTIDRMSPLEMVRVMNAEDARVALAVEQELPHIARAIEEIATRLRRGGRLIYFGAGTSGRLGALDAFECPPTFNIPPEKVIGCIAGGAFALTQAVEDLEDSAEAGHADAARLNIGETDAVVGITASGRTPYALGAIAYARKHGALTIGLACNSHSPLANEVEIMLAPVVGPEVINGSTRLKAGTAQKMVLNMLSTGTMILLGKTFGNLMVDVQATNYKLQQRAAGIVQQATGLDRDTAATLLQAAGGEVKTAILMGLTSSQAELARQQLAAHNASLRAALDAQQ
ncbi:MAG TPA: N-acetylmuramic acid 6-phosphate etherase [Ktedonobacteraceae bacterium]|nr:N-acetylmuramic acid 6-phosphate etherase [Ktedonobacteraceae bacterium]